MTVKLVPSTNYLNDRAKIMEDIIEYALTNEEDALPILKFFRSEEKALQRRIKNSPLSAGIDFPHPVKKGTSHSGKYVILYTYLPVFSSTNSNIKQVNLDSIYLAESSDFNNLYKKLVRADF